MNKCINLGYLVRFALLTGLLAGCGDNGAETMLVDYQQRLASLLEVPPPDPEAPGNIPAFPEPEARLFNLPDKREGLRDIYALRECRITNLIARRNNSLGRVAPPSQQWLYELALWRRLESCWQSTIPEQLSANDRERLEQLLMLKTRQLPKASWNALFASSEWINSFSRASSPLSPDKPVELSRPLAALAYLRQATRNQYNLDWQADSSTLEHHLQALSREPLSAELLRSLLLATQRLHEINHLFERHWRTDKRCPESQTFTSWVSQSEHQAMAYLEKIDNVGRRWLLGIEQLLNAHHVSRPAVSRYRQEWLSLDNPAAPWQRFQAARKHHDAYWRRLVAHCAGPASSR